MKKMDIGSFSLRAAVKKLRQIQLPSGLRLTVGKRYLTALAMILAIIAMAIYDKRPSYLLGLAIPAALIYLGVSTTLDFQSGAIEELAVICTSVRTYKARETTHVVFRTEDETPRYFAFVLPGKSHSEKLIPNSAYVIYFQSDRPESLLGYTGI